MATMSRKFPYFLAVLFIFSVIAPPIYADDQTVFGPEVFEIDEKGVHLSIQKLNVDDHGKGFIIVTKNTPDKRIKDGFIRFDKKVKKKGKLHKKGSIRLRKFLRGKKLVFEKKIKLRHANYLTVYLKGTPEASVTIEIKKADGAIPSPVVTFSADPQSIKLGQSSTLTWTTFNAESVNIDHGIVHKAVLSATRPLPDSSVKTIFSFEVPSSTDWNFRHRFSPNVYEDIEETIETKIRALQIYETELQEFPHPRSVEGVRILAQKRGAEVGINFAETFELLRDVRSI